MDYRDTIALMLAGLACTPAAAVAHEADRAADQEAMQAKVSSGWELVWSDEFDGEVLDREKWAPEVSCWGGGNDERQCYTDRPENIEVSGGTLKLKAQPEEWTGPAFPPEIAPDPNPLRSQTYTSGKVRTRDLASWMYGRFEARAKVPPGQGTWPAIWMMSQDNLYGQWPLSGEIDILETVNLGASCDECESGREDRTISALHYGDVPPGNAFISAKTPLPDGALPSEAFHTYAVEWGAGLIRFFVDDREHLTLTRDQWFTAASSAEGRENAPFDQPFYIMANLAVGGKLSETNNDKGIAPDTFPTQLEIDWVRVYRCRRDPALGLGCME